MRLFCFPPAGGGAISYFTWGNELPATVEVCPVELPGHGLRLEELPFKRLPNLMNALLEGLSAYMERPFAFFGHSMGALVAFELTRVLRHTHQSLPLWLFVSAFRAPHLPNPEPNMATLSDSGLIEKLQRLEGTPSGVLEHPELLELVLPALRADMEILDNYVYKPEPPLECSITAFGGISDPLVSQEQIRPWYNHTSAGFGLQLFPGGHFFLQSAQPLFLPVLSRTLESIEIEI